MSICQQSLTSQQAQSILGQYKAEEFAVQSYGMEMQSPMGGDLTFFFCIDFCISALCLSLLGTIFSHLKLMGSSENGMQHCSAEEVLQALPVTLWFSCASPGEHNSDLTGGTKDLIRIC